MHGISQTSKVTLEYPNVTTTTASIVAATCLMLGFYEELLPRWKAKHKRHIKLHDVQTL